MTSEQTVILQNMDRLLAKLRPCLIPTRVARVPIMTDRARPTEEPQP